MTFEEKKEELQCIIKEQLLPLVGKRCILLDAPYHVNAGDLLIWLGTQHFLKCHKIKLLYTRSADTFLFKKIPSDVTILLQGGGNFGDLWRYFQDFKLKIVQRYPNNKIIFLPQTIWYNDQSTLKQDVEILLKHEDVHLMTRDQRSYDILYPYFKRRVYLTPDMAFFISNNYLSSLASKTHLNKDLFVMRTDQEANTKTQQQTTSIHLDVHDWPMMEKTPYSYLFFNQIRNINGKFNRLMNRLGLVGVLFKNRFTWIEDYYMQHVCLPSIISQAVKFVSSYNYIYTTRLHVAILSTLLDKQYTFIDNSYGKNRGFYECWLKDVESIFFKYE